MLGPLGFFATGGSSGAFELISSTSLSANTATVTFSSIPQTYKHLQIRMVVRSTQNALNTNMTMQFNGAATSSYVSHYVLGSTGGSTPSSGANTIGTSMFLTDIAGATSTALVFGAMIIDIPDYVSTTKNKTVRAFAGAQSRVAYDSGLFIGTAAVSSIALTPYLSQFAAGSRVSLYGIKG